MTRTLIAVGVPAALAVLAVLAMHAGRDDEDVRVEDDRPSPARPALPDALAPLQGATDRTAETTDATPGPTNPPPSDAITGVVHDAYGRPLAGVAVAIRRQDDSDAPWTEAPAPSNAAGEFEIAPPVAGGLHTVTFRERAHVPRRIERVAAGTQLDVALRKGVPVHGRVVDATSSAPIAGAILSFGAADERTRSDADGTFECGIDSSGLFASVQKEGYLPWSGAPLHPVSGMELIVRLRPAVANALAYLVVTDAVDGQPLTSVHADPGPVVEFGGGLISTGTSPFERERYGTIRSPGHANTCFRLSESRGRTQQDAMPIALERAITVTGRLIDETGAPIAGVRVTASPAQPDERVFDADPTTTSARDGRFRLEALPARTRLQLTARDDRFVDAAPVEFARETEGDVALEPLVMRTSAPIRGRVVDAATGAPIGGASLVTRERARASRSAQSARDGTFTLFGAAGPARLLASAPGYAATFIDDVAPDADAPLEVALEPGLSITGVVLDRERRPVAAATVRILRWRVPSSRPELSACADAGSQRGKIEADSDGRFALTGLLPGDYWLEAVRSDTQPGEPSAAPTLTLAANVTDVELPLVEPSVIAGRVADARTGVPIVAFTLGLAEGRSESWSDATDGDGRFLEIARPGVDYAVTIMADRHAPFRLAPVRLEVGEVRELVCALEPESAIDGVLVGDDGAPLACAEIRIASEPNPAVESSPISTSGDGTFHIGQLAAGEVFLFARARFDLAEGAAVTCQVEISPDSVVLAPGESLVQRFVARTAGTAALEVEVVLPQDGTVAGARVLVDSIEADRRVAEISVKRSGLVRITPIPAGRYRFIRMIDSASGGTTILDSPVGAPDVTVPESGAARARVEIPARAKPKGKP